jgi:activator of 2-hydroxyglutaryl-CoA dehydratase
MNKFQETIKEHLENITDEDFKAKYNSEKIEDCCNYIISEVKKSGREGFADEEIFEFAKNFYLQEIKEVEMQDYSKVVINRKIEKPIVTPTYSAPKPKEPAPAVKTLFD